MLNRIFLQLFSCRHPAANQAWPIYGVQRCTACGARRAYSFAGKTLAIGSWEYPERDDRFRMPPSVRFKRSVVQSLGRGAIDARRVAKRAMAGLNKLTADALSRR